MVFRVFQVWNQQATFCLWILQCWWLGKGWMEGKEGLFLQTPSPPPEGNSEGKECERSQEPLPEQCQKHSCSTDPSTRFQLGWIEKADDFKQGCIIPKILCLYHTKYKAIWKFPNVSRCFRATFSSVEPEQPVLATKASVSHLLQWFTRSNILPGISCQEQHCATIHNLHSAAEDRKKLHIFSDIYLSV